ncbi:Structural maintenance of chromosomes protein 2 [Clydaea vesicula]|uniref:Structural maintenance of chromosomes protein n=1 Tax=Clydaea vesicula TaxID=447962 RepID=A0AAD5TZT6_9FUNG|nr:Structural maintenance of chromosomes protein 2 [Clydaea vesicula]
MYLEEIILDGFKSYASRTTISQWDPEFNAITGLNGSGKSNILDAICFALGISQMQPLRAANLNDLIYKKGQAGVQRASVTLVFNNENKENGPLAFEDHQKISVTRQVFVGIPPKNKYYINAVNATQAKVASLFQSVSLDVNHPHFLIMQGKITKVLNMKPPEILAMVEEAAGTRLFEEKKLKAKLQMEKKEMTLKDTTETLEQEIIPRLDKLREQKRAFMEFRKINLELDSLKNYIIAHDYFHGKEKIKKFEKSQVAKMQVIFEMATEMENLQNLIMNLMESKEKLEEEMKSSEFKLIEEELSSATKHLKLIETQSENKLSTVQEEIKNREKLEVGLLEFVKTISDSRVKKEKLKAEYSENLQDNEKKSLYVKKQEQLLQTLKTGISANEGHENGYMDQLKESKKESSNFLALCEKSKIKMQFLKKEIKNIEPKTKKAISENKKFSSELENSRKQVEQLKVELEKFQCDPEKEIELRREKSLQQEVISTLQEKIENLEREISPFQFAYTDPTANFDRNKVKGIVAELVELDKNSLVNCTALEVCAGSRLFNVVVENEVVGSQLLENGKLKKRYTIIPLNKISAFKAKAEVIATAKDIAPGKVELALTLIGCDEEVSKAMEFVFGGTFVCKDDATAKAVTFNKKIKLKSVTVDGDIYDPSGTLSGGSEVTSGGILLKMKNLKESQLELKKNLFQLKQTNEEIQQYTKYSDCKAKFDLKSHENSILEKKFEENEASKLINKFEELKKSLNEEEISIQENTLKHEKEIENQKNLELEMNELANHRDSKLKSIEKDLLEAKAALAKDAPAVKLKQQEIDLVEEEIKQSEVDLIQMQEQINSIDILIKTLENELKEINLKFSEAKKQVEKVNAKLEKEKKNLKKFDSELREQSKLIQEKKNQLKDTEIQRDKLVRDKNQSEIEKKDIESKLKKFLKDYPWIQDEEKFFGESGSKYDFASSNIQDKEKRKSSLEEQRHSMKKSIKTDVEKDISREEKREAALKQKVTLVKKDKKKIQDTIVNLENEASETLMATWKKVNINFGNIFGDLLSGNTAKLEPLEGQDISKGLEVKVCLGGVWKQSLAELSGGQRSLIALSLIMSLLQFKPAPLYILDEIDAALDLDHTQNIGQLFKNRFKGAQFIVVSLKEGMFNNANVLFKAKFRDGLSYVDRIAQKNSKGNTGYGTPSPKKIAHRRVSMLSKGLSSNLKSK